MHDESLQPQKPVLSGLWHRIGPNPDLGRLQGPSRRGSPQECVDHHLYQAWDGSWHLWGCIRGTKIGRLLYHWRSDTLLGNWQATGEYIRASAAAGESLDDWYGEEWIQSPYILRHSGQYFMFYGGHAVGAKKQPRLKTKDFRKTDGQICLMTSGDGYRWQRYQNEQGQSRLFMGPGEARDPCLLFHDELFILYYAGYEYAGKEEKPGIYARTSADLKHWSKPRLVHRWRHPDVGGHPWDTECPLVIEHEGLFYLFRTENYGQAKTHVFCSRDPFDLGIDDAAEAQYVTPLAVAAPEVVRGPGGHLYITSNHDLTSGTQLCRLDFRP